MGILPSAVGPEPIVRLQAGGLKVGEVLHRLKHQPGAMGARGLTSRVAGIDDAFVDRLHHDLEVIYGTA
jgi:hypothetical protein